MLNNQNNRDMKKIVITMALTVLSLAPFAKDNFKMTGKIDGVGNDTLCIEYVILQPQKQIVNRKIVVKSGEFSFSAKLSEAYSGLMFLKSNPEEILNTYFVPDEEAVFSGRLDLIEAHWSGSTFYQQYERVTNLQRPFDVEFAAVRNEPDSIRVLKNRDINSRSHPTYMKYIEEPLVRSLIFIKTTPTGLREVKMRYSSSLIPYYDHSREDGTKPPVTVPEAQMEMFIRLCRMKEAGLEYLGEDEPKYHLGDRVRVTDGIFKGFEGHIKRIRHDRKLIVTIEGVAAFATRFIPPSMLERVE